MTPRQGLAAGGLIALVALGAYLLRGPGEGGTELPAETPAALNGVAVVTLSAESQEQGGIILRPVEGGEHAAETTAFGRVEDLSPLLELRARYDAARAGRETAQAALEVSRADYRRLSLLNKDDRNVSTKAVQQAEAAYKSDEARLNSALGAFHAAEGAIRQNFGDGILERFGAGDEVLDSLVSGATLLLRVVVPPGEAARSEAGRIVLYDAHDDAGGGDALQATFLSAPFALDPVSLGAVYFFQISSSTLRPGSAIRVRLALGEKKPGVLIGESAVVWQAGRAWAYVRADETRFVRRLVDSSARVGNAWFTAKGFQPGELLVVQGAQMLLSEELRWQVEGGDDDD